VIETTGHRAHLGRSAGSPPRPHREPSPSSTHREPHREPSPSSTLIELRSSGFALDGI
jgi:hypothetical protein